MIISPTELASIRQRHHSDIIVYASGCFDIIHPGHVKLVQYLKTLGDVVVIGVTPDVRVAERKGPKRPINTQDARAAVVDALEAVSYTFITPESVPGVRIVGHHVLRTLKPDVYVTDDPAWIADKKMLTMQNTQIQPGPELAQGYSTTTMIDRIVERYRKDTTDG